MTERKDAELGAYMEQLQRPLAESGPTAGAGDNDIQETLLTRQFKVRGREWERMKGSLGDRERKKEREEGRREREVEEWREEREREKKK